MVARLPCTTPDKQVDVADALDHPRLKRFASVVYLHLDANAMTGTSSTDEEEPRMGADGRQLASALAWMAGAQPDTLARIASDLARAVPGVRRILAYRERITERIMEQIRLDGQPVWRPVERSRIGDRFAIEFEVGGACASRSPQRRDRAGAGIVDEAPRAGTAAFGAP